jgi:hypothetical protein
MKKEQVSRKGWNKRGQVTIFVIVAIVLVFIIAGFFLINRENSDIPSLKENPTGNIKANVEKCTRQAIDEAEKIVIKNAGFLEQENPFVFNYTSYELLCDSSGTNNLCTNNHPALLIETQKEVLEYITPKINSCFETIKSSLRNYKYQENANTINVTIVPNEIRVEIIKNLVFEINDQVINIEKFNVKANSPLYDFLTITNKIINEELNCNCGSESCNANLVNLMRYNREFEVLKPVYSSNGQEAFTITEINSGKQFRFAIRNCAYD